MGAMGRCRHCQAEFALARLLDDWTGRCPSCRVPLAEDGRDRACILRNAAAVERLHGELIRALRQIVAVPGQLEIEASAMVRSVLGDVGWEAQLADDLSFTQREIEQVRSVVQSWTNRLGAPAGIAGQPDDAAVVGEMRELAHRLRHVGDSMDADVGTPAGAEAERRRTAIHAAAASVDDAARGVAAGRGDRPVIEAALDQAHDAVSGGTPAPSDN